MKRLFAFALGLLFSLGSVAALNAAPQFGVGRDRVQGEGRDRVCFYQDVQYRGWEQCYNVGDEVANLGNRKKAISSIRVFGRARVTVWEDPDFRGRSGDFTSNTADLGLRTIAGGQSWNDQIESFRIESDSGYYDNRNPRNVPPYGNGNGNGPFGNARNNPPAWGRNQAGVCVYDRRNFQGNQECFRSGDDVRDLARTGSWSDRIQSIRVFGNATAVLYRDTNFRGDSVVVNRDIADLRDLRGRNSSRWDRQVSSLTVQNVNRARRYLQ